MYTDQNTTWFATLRSRLQDHLRQVRTRRELLDMPAHQLRDIGLTESQARCEALRPVWDASSQPKSRRQDALDIAAGRGTQDAVKVYA